MTHAPIVVPSILAADFSRLADEVADVSEVVPWVHLDVMDGHYVPNLTIGPAVVESLRQTTGLHFDTHLMITDPRQYGPTFVAAGADSVTIHPETDDDLVGLLSLLREEGAEVGVAVRPRQDLSLIAEVLEQIDLLLIMTVEPGFGGQSFMEEVVPKIADAAARRDRLGARFRLEVDGGIAPDTARRCADAGADTFVAGSAVFGRPDRHAAVAAILDAAGRQDELVP